MNQAAGHGGRWGAGTALTGRRAERTQLDQLVGQVARDGVSRALVIHGEAGVGKSALLDYAAAQARGCSVLRAGGVQSEMELAFAGLHQLCAPLLEQVGSLPAPQRQALQVAFGLSEGAPPERFVIGLAVLGLLSHAAAARPLICLVDDEQWLDRCSAQVLGFVARRLGAESVGMIFATRDPAPDGERLAQLEVSGLSEAEAGELLDVVLTVPIDRRVRDQIIAETRGNPLALLELPRELTPTQLAGGFNLPGAMPISGRVEDSYRRRIEALPAETRSLLLLVAADPTGDPALMCRAAALLGIPPEASGPASEARLAEFGTRPRFRHPLARSAAYRAATDEERRAAHRALAEATDAQVDPDRRAWHRAQACPGPDEEVAAELEHSAARAKARGGLAGAAAFLAKAATLTEDPETRTGRALAAAQANLQAGCLDAARELLTMLETAPFTEAQQVKFNLQRARLAFVTQRGGQASALLLDAARRLEHIDQDLSRATYLDALSAAIFAGPLAAPGGDMLTVAHAAAAAPALRQPPRAPDLLLEGIAACAREGYAAGAPALHAALDGFDDMSAEEQLRWMWIGCIGAMRVWDGERWSALATRYVELVREAGALSELPLALTMCGYMHLLTGDLGAAEACAEELETLTEAIGGGLAPYCTMGLAALRGVEDRATALVAATIEEANQRGEGIGAVYAEWAAALLHNGLGQYGEALAAAQRATASDQDVVPRHWALVELVEAGVRGERADLAAEACAVIGEMAAASGTGWLLGAHARCRALLADGEEADRLYNEAIAYLGKTGMRPDLARTHLLYGEWLRRVRRRTDAREQLRTAQDLFEAMGMSAFARRAARELQATGETAKQRTGPADPTELTAQEAQIARLARDGLSNPEIGTRLFISAHTVQYHLRKVFTKLNITSRSQLDRVLPAEPSPDRVGR